MRLDFKVRQCLLVDYLHVDRVVEACWSAATISLETTS